ncbi:uncharacterized protein SPPG_04512 [Spizellomyces punctatus DAOM BR117]|uniref:Uncharacterized protein n=1 Tax=Spizellomyces punctatus (strain DAOM BR117) TaxID=645134 RepID=A0A0L0HFC7_SPIPD|nr:uncharacterized protein SPPG_04512 [Spizellomyces punctatus DAOM BR117]KND00171.1 hypothetical protein SPPG_04512 [Spizellomyces punctatus DAOM BR117]|eukprot:XP_016608210.1 hypothetical protein SPPG_04512 [Spizellomyces punctatus DAOM BR117]
MEGGPMLNGVIISATVKATSDNASPKDMAPSYQKSTISRLGTASTVTATKPAFTEGTSLQSYKMEQRSMTTERVRLAEIDLEKVKEMEREKTKRLQLQLEHARFLVTRGKSPSPPLHVSKSTTQ